MAEFNIKRNVGNRGGLYHRGSLIGAYVDGGYDAKPWLTTIKVVGMKLEDALRFIQPVYRLEDREEIFDEASHDFLSADGIIGVFLNSLNFKMHYKMFLGRPLKSKFEESGVTYYRLKGKIPVIDRKSRFQIPKELMDKWYSNGENVRIISLEEFNEDVFPKMIDTFHNGTCAEVKSRWEKKDEDAIFYDQYNIEKIIAKAKEKGDG